MSETIVKNPNSVLWSNWVWAY